MKIAILTSGILPVPAHLGGAVENLIDYYTGYNDRHRLHEMTVYSVAPPTSVPRSDTPYVRYHYVDMKSPFHRLKRALFVRTHKGGYYNSYINYFFHEALRHIRRQHYDAIILENRPGYALPVAKATDARIILHLHNDFLNKESRQAAEILHVTDTVITVSNFIKERVETIPICKEENSSTHRLQLRTVHNGIDLQRFYRATPISRSSLGFNESDFIVVYSGRINPEKGVKELIQAFKQLTDHPDIKLLILGSSFFGAGSKNSPDPFVQSLREECRSLPAGTITFTGFIPYDQIPSYLKLANIAVVPSMWDDPFPTTVLEAIAAGLPLIATNSGGIKEACSDCAIILEKENIIDGLRDSIIHLHSSPTQRASMRESGLAQSHRYDKERYAKEFIMALEE